MRELTLAGRYYHVLQLGAALELVGGDSEGRGGGDDGGGGSGFGGGGRRRGGKVGARGGVQSVCDESMTTS